MNCAAALEELATAGDGVAVTVATDEKDDKRFGATDEDEAEVGDIPVDAVSEGSLLVAVASAAVRRDVSGSALCPVWVVAAAGLVLVVPTRGESVLTASARLDCVSVDEASEAPLPRIRA